MCLSGSYYKARTYKKVYCAPGNAGVAEIAECIPISADNIAALVDFALEQEIELTVVGPELPLTAGIVDEFIELELTYLVRNREAAKLEGSKVFAKQLMEKYQIPTAESRTFTNADKALAYLKEKGVPIVVKADGLAAGKGVVVATTLKEAETAVQRMLVNEEFGEAGKRVVI